MENMDMLDKLIPAYWILMGQKHNMYGVDISRHALINWSLVRDQPGDPSDFGTLDNHRCRGLSRDCDERPETKTVWGVRFE